MPLVILLVGAASAHAGTYVVTACSYYGNTAPAFQASGTAAHLAEANECMVWNGFHYRSLEINQAGANVLYGYGAKWSTITPSPAIMIVNVFTPVNTVLVDCTLNTDGFTAQYFWGDYGLSYGTQAINYINGCGSQGQGIGYADGINRYVTPSRYFGWSVDCWLNAICSTPIGLGNRILAVNGVQLEAQENTGPSVYATPYPGNLWYQPGWVRGSWPLTSYATDPSGVCSMATIFDHQAVANWSDPFRDSSSWTQCHGSQLPAQIDTTRYADGHHLLAYWATNAAGVLSAPTRDDANRNPVLVDNTPVSLTLSGPSDAPATAGTQYVTASATAGPSGVAGIACSTDGSPYGWHAGASEQIPVQGLGPHRVSCYAQNRSLDPYGHPAISPSQSWILSIRQPTVAAISFSKIVGALRCGPVLERIKVPGKWTLLHRHHKLGRVRKRAHFETVRVIRCHARTERRRVTVWVTVRRHGKKVPVKRTEIVRVVVPPHLVGTTTRRVAHGDGTTVSGWLGTTNFTALAGQPVEVLTAPDNGHDAFTRAAIVTTGPDGFWTAHLPPGPSRLIEAQYPGGTTTEPTVSSPVRVVAPASVRLHLRPRRTRWGGTIQITGSLRGGYIPPAGELVVLRIGWPGGSTEIGHLYAGPDGRFHSTYTFLRGNGTAAYRIWAASARESDYPYAPATSRRIAVTVHPG